MDKLDRLVQPTTRRIANKLDYLVRLTTRRIADTLDHLVRPAISRIADTLDRLVQTTTRRIAYLLGRRDDVGWLNGLLAGGLLAINLIAFGVTYWLATRDILAEFTGEVRVDRAEAPGATRPPDGAPAKPLKRSSLSKKSEPVPVEEPRPIVSLPLPPFRVNESKPSEVPAAPIAPAPPRVVEAPLASPSMAQLSEPESPELPAAPRDTSAGGEARSSSESP